MQPTLTPLALAVVLVASACGFSTATHDDGSGSVIEWTIRTAGTAEVDILVVGAFAIDEAHAGQTPGFGVVLAAWANDELVRLAGWAFGTDDGRLVVVQVGSERADPPALLPGGWGGRDFRQHVRGTASEIRVVLASNAPVVDASLEVDDPSATVERRDLGGSRIYAAGSEDFNGGVHAHTVFMGGADLARRLDIQATGPAVGWFEPAGDPIGASSCQRPSGTCGTPPFLADETAGTWTFTLDRYASTDPQVPLLFLVDLS